MLNGLPVSKNFQLTRLASGSTIEKKQSPLHVNLRFVCSDRVALTQPIFERID